MRHTQRHENWWSQFQRHPDILMGVLDHKRSCWRYEQYLGLQGRTFDPIVAEADSPILVIGPPGSSKTSSGLIPVAILAPGAMAFIGPRADGFRATARTRARIGRVWHFSAYGSTVPGAKDAKFSVLQGCEDETAADRIAMRIASYVDRSEFALQTNNKGHLHFRSHAHAVLFALMFIAANTEQPMGMGWVYKFTSSPMFTKSLVTLTRDLESHPNYSKLQPAIEVLAWIASISPEERGSALSTAAHAVAAYRDPNVVEHSKDAGFDFDAFVSGKPTKIIQGTVGFDSGILGQHGVYPPFRGSFGSVYITDASAESPAAVIYAEFEFRLREAAYKLSLERELEGAPKPTPITIINDEMAVAPITQLSEYLAQMRDRGVLAVFGAQSISQIRAIYPGIGNDIVTLARTLVCHRGIKDKETLELLSLLSGRAWKDITSRSVTQGKDRSEGTSTGPQLIEQLRPEQIAVGHPYWPDAALVLNSQAKTFWIRTTPYFMGEPWPRLLITHLQHSIRKESRLPLPRFERQHLEPLGLWEQFHDLKIIFKQYSGGKS